LSSNRSFVPDGIAADLAKACVRPFRRRLKQLMSRRHQEQISEPFAEECRSVLSCREPAAAECPWIVADVSDPLHYSFGKFCSLIAGARVVITTRLHAGLFGAMVGVPTYLRTGRYGKIRGVYEQSLVGYPHVRLFGEGGQILSTGDRDSKAGNDGL